MNPQSNFMCLQEQFAVCYINSVTRHLALLYPQKDVRTAKASKQITTHKRVVLPLPSCQTANQLAEKL